MGDNYLKLAGASLQHIRIVCFVSRDHYHKISNVKTATVATGLAGVIGNKGCSAITFSFFDAKFCFIGSHLAARIDRKRLEARNQNYRDILKGLASGFSTNGTEKDTKQNLLFPTLLVILVRHNILTNILLLMSFVIFYD